MAILYTWRLNCRKTQLSSDMHLPRDQVCKFKARHPLCWATTSLTPQFCVRNQHMHLHNTDKRQESKRHVVMEWLLRWLHRLHTETLAGAGEGGAELEIPGESTPGVRLIMTLPWSQLLLGTSSPCKPEPARTHNAGEAPPPSPNMEHQNCKTEPLLPTPVGSMAPVCLRSWALTNLTLPQWWQQSVKPITLNYFYSWL